MQLLVHPIMFCMSVRPAYDVALFERRAVLVMLVRIFSKKRWDLFRNTAQHIDETTMFWKNNSLKKKKHIVGEAFVGLLLPNTSVLRQKHVCPKKACRIVYGLSN